MPTTVLVIDDEEIIRQSVNRDLSDAGYDVTTATGGWEGLALFRQEEFDAVITDLVMDDMDGIEVLEKIKKLSPKTVVIILTGFANVNATTSALRIGADDFISKPCSADDLKLRLTRSLEKQVLAARIKESEEKYRQFIEGTNNLVLQINPEGLCTFVNHAARNILGIEPDDCVGHSILDFIHPDDRSATEEIFQALLRGEQQNLTLENRILNIKGGIHDMLWTINLHHGSDGRVKAINSTVRDITERKESENQIWQLANFDVLTDLPNRSLFMERLDQAINQSNRTGSLLCLMFIDLDNFKNVNDSLGHQAGDELLVEVARRLENCLRKTDTIARLGGDEFTVILTNIREQDDVIPLTRQILRTLANSFHVANGHEVFVSGSIGLTFCPSDASDAQTLMKNADTAMYRAKDSGRNAFAFYTRSLDQEIKQQIQMENELRRAIDQNEFELHYQPIINFTNNEVMGIEALLRWNHPQRGLLLPNDFLTYAEKSGLIIPVGEWVINQAASQLGQWQNDKLPGCQELSLSINCSNRQFREPICETALSEVMADSSLPMAALGVEINSDLLEEGRPQTAGKLEALKKMGIAVVLNNFGTGFASINWTRLFAVDAVKINSSIVRDCPTNAQSGQIIKALIAMARNLELQIIAEGIETEEQYQFLLKEGCNAGQGYFLARPMPVADLGAFLQKQKAAGN